ncbi:MAG TPA: hypothetical protein VFH80_04455 [Solirubrobacteraceae bacterium]|nr:hypothetical protein [Solirubrobacteraceae bacterium]
MTRSAPPVDLAIAVAVAIIVLIIFPGWAVVAIVAVAVLLVVGVSFVFTGWRDRRSGQRRRASARRNFRRGGGF